MLAYKIYYVDIITFVYKISLFHPHNAHMHLAFCPRNESSILLSVHEIMCSLHIFLWTQC